MNKIINVMQNIGLLETTFHVINFKVYLKNLETLVNPQFQYMIFGTYLNLLLKESIRLCIIVLNTSKQS